MAWVHLPLAAPHCQSQIASREDFSSSNGFFGLSPCFKGRVAQVVPLPRRQ